jgi:7-cyano-7-deazaguanine synthase in queuosine biosynthesis
VIEPRLFLCSGAKIEPDDPLVIDRRIVALNSIGRAANVNIRLENVAKVFGRHLPPRIVDLLEIAAYVFSADCSTPRGTQWSEGDTKEPWSRDLAFVLPVRDIDFWTRPKISTLIVELLTFLSDDRCSFRFVPLTHDRPYRQEYLKLGKFEDWLFYAPERVLMFSGGIDSLAGAVETAKSGKRAILVSHRPVSTMSARQKKLFRELQKSFPDQFIHVPVWINKQQGLGKEPTQRTRSFLFAALGTVVAHSIKAGGVRFFENGVVSLNLPVADEVLRSRASRTTHPKTLYLLQSLCMAIADRNLVIDNPYLYKTKTEVLDVLSRSGVPNLIAQTCSCAHSMFKPRTQWHCGTCSQCIDRRFAVVAAGLQQYDPASDYQVDVFLGPRKDGPEKNMAVDYVRHAIELCHRPEEELGMTFNAEISRAVLWEVDRNKAAKAIVATHKRHGKAVTQVLGQKIAEKATEVLNGTLDGSSLLGLAIRQEHLGTSSPSSRSRTKDESGLLLPDIVRAMFEESVERVLAKIGPSSAEPKRVRRRKLDKRETVIFAAILMGLRGERYCAFMHEQQIRPKWSDRGGPATYPQSYARGGAWRKAVQDEKSRAKDRMDRYSESELANGFITFFKDQFDHLSVLLQARNSRNSRSASSKPQMSAQA